MKYKIRVVRHRYISEIRFLFFTDFSPPPTDVSIENVMVIPSLHFIQENVKLLINGEWVDTINFTPYTQFTCQFNQQADYFYAVNWYVLSYLFYT
jgi:hypothetical protein